MKKHLLLSLMACLPPVVAAQDTGLLGATLTDSYVSPKGAFVNIVTPGGSIAHAGLLGGDVITGKRLALNNSIFVEPEASLSYSNTQVGDTTSGSTLIHFGSNDSLRGGAGIRIAALVPGDGNTIDFSLTGRVWDQFESSNVVTLTTNGAVLPLTGKSLGTIGEVVGGVKVFGGSLGFSGFLDAALDFGGNIAAPA